MIEILIIVNDDDEHCDPIDQFKHTSRQMAVNGPGVKSKNTDQDTDEAAYMGEGAVNSNLDELISQGDDRSAIIILASFAPEIPEDDDGATLNEKEQFDLSVQEDSIAKASGKRSRSLSGPGQADDHGSGWIFDIFAEDDGGAKVDGSPASKRARSSSRPLETVENGLSPTAAALTEEYVQVPGSAHDDRPPQGDQEYEVHRIVGESGSEYEVTALTKIRLPKASVDPKLVRKYRVEQRAATRIPTRRSSRLRNKN